MIYVKVSAKVGFVEMNSSVMNRMCNIMIINCLVSCVCVCKEPGPIVSQFLVSKVWLRAWLVCEKMLLLIVVSRGLWGSPVLRVRVKPVCPSLLIVVNHSGNWQRDILLGQYRGDNCVKCWPVADKQNFNIIITHSVQVTLCGVEVCEMASSVNLLEQYAIVTWW